MSAPLVFVLGDSISIQYGPFLAEMLAPTFRLERKQGDKDALKNLDIPQGANGGDSSRVRAYLEAICSDPSWRPDLLLLNCGLHDIKTDRDTSAKQVPLPTYEENLRAVTSLLKDRGTPLLWVRTTPVDERLHNDDVPPGFFRFESDVDIYNTCADSVMQDAGVDHIDLFTFTRGLGGREIFADHVHFPESIQKLQAAFLAGHVQRWFARSR